MIHHIDFVVTDFERSLAFYVAALAPLDIWIHEGKVPPGRLHVAFRASSRSAVDLFYAAALAAGCSDQGPPGLRPQYAAHYYSAYVLDPDGHNIEAVCRLVG